MEDKNICQETFEKIKASHIKPKPRWEFLLKNYIFWSMFILSLIIGALAVSVIIFMAQNDDWDLYEKLSGGLLNFVFATLPYFWLIVMIAFIAIADYYFHHTRTGYRYNLLLIIVISIGSSAMLGAIAHSVGLGKIIVDTMSVKIPIYENLNFNRAKMWIQPENGLLAGTIINLLNDENFGLDDFTSHSWIIFAHNAKLKDRAKIEIGENIKLIGELLDDGGFRAIEIRPWGRTCIMNTCKINP
jgi:hypothetical protein